MALRYIGVTVNEASDKRTPSNMSTSWPLLPSIAVGAFSRRFVGAFSVTKLQICSTLLVRLSLCYLFFIRLICLVVSTVYVTFSLSQTRSSVQATLGFK